MFERQFLELLVFKTRANLNTEISKYYLNYLWWVLEPVLMMGVFYVVFGIFLNRGTEHFAAFLLTGLTAWNWFNRSVLNASGSIQAGHGLMMQVNITKVFFPLEVFLRDAFKHLFVVGLLLLFLVAYPTPIHITWIALPLLLITQGLLVLGISILCAALVPFLPDLKFIISTGMTLIFFGSGIFFNIESVVLPEHRGILYLNPMAGLISAYRDILIHGQWPDWIYLLKVFLAGLLTVWGSVALVRRYDHIYPRVSQ
jgi:lipopolysaccharide transport system permease protein